MFFPFDAHRSVSSARALRSRFDGRILRLIIAACFKRQVPFITSGQSVAVLRSLSSRLLLHLNSKVPWRKIQSSIVLREQAYQSQYKRDRRLSVISSHPRRLQMALLPWRLAKLYKKCADIVRNDFTQYPSSSSRYKLYTQLLGSSFVLFA